MVVEEMVVLALFIAVCAVSLFGATVVVVVLVVFISTDCVFLVIVILGSIVVLSKVTLLTVAVV